MIPLPYYALLSAFLTIFYPLMFVLGVRIDAEVLFDMTGYKTDSCSDSSDDEDGLPRGILSDSERHGRSTRKKFRRSKSHLSMEQRHQLLEDIKQGAFLKPEESLANTQIERQSKHTSLSHLGDHLSDVSAPTHS